MVLGTNSFSTLVHLSSEQPLHFSEGTNFKCHNKDKAIFFFAEYKDKGMHYFSRGSLIHESYFFLFLFLIRKNVSYLAKNVSYSYILV
jgi:hypothetical protein